MKKLVVLMCVLAMASLSVADPILAYNFDGADVYSYGGGTVVSGTGNTTGDNSLMVAGGGWGPAWEMYIGYTDLQTVLAGGGTISVDITTVASDFPEGEGWGSVGLLVNAGGETTSIWNTFDWQGLTIGTTQTLTFSLPPEVTAEIPLYNWWMNVGLIASGPAAIAEVPPTYDEITGELLDPGTPGVTPTYYYDNVQYNIPEPATLSLLGLGALSLIRRKR